MLLLKFLSIDGCRRLSPGIVSSLLTNCTKLREIDCRSCILADSIKPLIDWGVVVRQKD